MKRQQVDIQPIRVLGEFTARIRLTMDLVPEIKIIVHRDGESAESVTEHAAEAEKVEKAEKPKKSGRKAKEEAAAEQPVATAE